MVIYGDYDADGVTATALLVQVLQTLGIDASGYIPNRFEEGYGLNVDALESLKAGGASLVITVDCGIRSPEEAEFARKIGLDLIITDHHHPSDELPHAVAVINPKQPGDTYPEKELAGVGLAYKLAAALASSFDSQLDVEEHLDLVALGTVSDMAPLRGENRALVRAGLQRLRRPSRQGILSLTLAAGLRPERLGAGDISFGLGPRLNAAGRLDTAMAALSLLTTTNLDEASMLSQQLDNQNRERQQITRQIQQHAEKIALADNPDALLLFAADPGYNPGVVGLAASRLQEIYHRPAIVAYQGDEFTRGSCRSIDEFHITNALDRCADLMEHHGGHAAAAGFTIRNERVPELIQRLQAIAEEQLGGLDLRHRLHADRELSLGELKPELLTTLDRLQPTGTGNPEARFVSRGVRVIRSRAVGDGAHLKLTVGDGRIIFDAIAFRQGHLINSLPERLNLLYVFEVNEFNGFEKLQLNVKDIHPG